MYVSGEIAVWTQPEIHVLFSYYPDAIGCNRKTMSGEGFRANRSSDAHPPGRDAISANWPPRIP